MRMPELWSDLSEFVLENQEYLLTDSGLAGDKKKCGVDYARFRGEFQQILLRSGMISKSLTADAEKIVEELKEFPKTKILNEILGKYRPLCASIRVIDCYSMYPNFFLAPFENPESLDAVFHKNKGFHELNQALAQLFQNEDKRKTHRASCKGYYYCALKGLDFVEQRKVKSTGIQAGNFSELSYFFSEYPLIRDFIDDNLEKIVEYAEIFSARNSAQPAKKPLEEAKSQVTLFRRSKSKRKSDAAEAHHEKASRFRIRFVCRSLNFEPVKKIKLMDRHDDAVKENLSITP